MNFSRLQSRAREQWQEFESPSRPLVLVGSGTCGRAAGASDILVAAQEYLDKQGIDADLHEVGCLGLCYTEPLVELAAPGKPRVLYGNLAGSDIPDVMDAYLSGDDLCPDKAVAVMDGGAQEGIPAWKDHKMVHPQKRIVLRNCGRIDPENINHYIARGGYEGLHSALQMSPSEVIKRVKDSGLRGRGGAGFPTGLKWEFCNRESSDVKYMICNADEGDPGAFMDRSVIEGDPHSVVEGLAIAAYAIGASEGYIYIRAEYPLAIERLKKAMAQAQELGLLDDDMMDSGFSLDLHIKKGAGAFVCGEETAMLASIEGRRGHPRPRPPFPAQKGLHDRPTNINNVETLANVPEILRRSPEWFSNHGTEKSPGTKTFALAGKINRTGLVEVPLGITLREVVYEVGGGIPDDRDLKAVQTGGPSGGCIPYTKLDLPVDYESLSKAGSIMGSGGMVVMDEGTCMVDIARYFIEFTYEESCGKCAPCRLGTRQMLEILNNITRGESSDGDLELLEETAEAVTESSLCGLGQTAPNPVLTTLRYFRHEYEEHMEEGRCRAGICQALTTFEIDKQECVACGKCMKDCPVDAIPGEDRQPDYIDDELCTRCRTCYEECPVDAIHVV